MAEAAQAQGEALQLVTFRLGDELYGISILSVQEIIRITQFTRVPNAPPFVEGVMNLRGQVIPVVDLRKRLKLPPAQRDSRNRVIVVDLKGQRAGFIVDAVDKVMRAPAGSVDPPPTLSGGVEAEFLRGVARLDGERLLVLLDFEKILSQDEREDLGKVA